MRVDREIADELAAAEEMWGEIRSEREPGPTLAAGSADGGRGQAPTEPAAPEWGQLTRSRTTEEWRTP